MSVLVAHTSASTCAEIAQQIADRLRKGGLPALARPVEEVNALEPYQAVVLGSAVRNRVWLPEASEFLSKFEARLSKVPVWLFSSYVSADSQRLFDTRLAHTQHRDHAQPTGPCPSVPLLQLPNIQIRDHRCWSPALISRRRGAIIELLLQVCGGAVDARFDYREINDWTARIARDLHAIEHARERRRLHLSVRGRPG